LDFSVITNSIKTKIALMVSLFVLITAFLVGMVFYIGINNYTVDKELDTLEHYLEEESLLLFSTLQARKSDALFLSATPPIAGIIRVSTSKTGIDPLDGSTRKQWLDRLSTIFEQMLIAKPEFLSIRFIGLNKELVRVNNLDGITHRVMESNLQNKSSRNYFIETIKLNKAEIYLSKIELAREFGKITIPHLPVIRISTPVFDQQGIPFGIIIINMNFTILLNNYSDIGHMLGKNGNENIEIYLTSAKGDFIYHHDKRKMFGFDLGKRYRIQDLYPAYGSLINSDKKTGSVDQLLNQFEDERKLFSVDGVDKVAYFHKAYFDSNLPERFLGMAIVVNYNEVINGSYTILNKSIFLVLLLVVIASILAFIIANVITRKLLHITDAAKDFVAGDRNFNLSVNTKDEIGILAHTLQDMMDQVKIHDQALRKSEARFSGIIELAEDAIISLDDEHKIILFNQGAEKIFGFNKKDMIGKNIDQLLPDRIKNKHSKYIGEFSSSKDNARSMISRNALLGIRKNGESFPMEASISRLKVNNKFIFTAIIRDTSIQEQAKDALLSIKKNLSDAQNIAKMGSYVWSIESDAMEWSDELYQILDYRLGSHIPALNKITSRVCDDDYARFNRALEKVFALEKSVDISFRIVLPDGERRSIVMSFRLREVEAGSSRQVAGTIQDVTHQIKTVEEKQLLEKQLQQSQKMDAIGQLTGGIAHDFNNILASIMGYTNLAQERFAQDNPKLEEYLDEVYRAGERARDLISQMLAFSRGGTTEARLIAVQPLVKEAMKMLKSTIPSSIDVTTDYQTSLPEILMDPVQMHQLVMNLCINARDAMGGRGKLDIKLRTVNINNNKLKCSACKNQIQGQFLELQIRDNGCGIDQAVMDKIFDPFFTTKEVGKGTGMGLSMVHGIMHEQDGHIILSSVQGEGSVFKLLFPVAEIVKRDEKPTRVENIEKAIVPQNKTSTNKKHILVVDDERSVAGFLRELFETRGYRVTVEIDSVKALEIFKKDPGKFDLVITDQTMPKLTGAELSKQILSTRSSMPIILCTGYSEVIDENQAFEIGINEYLTKPIDPVKLCNAVTRLSGHVN